MSQQSTIAVATGLHQFIAHGGIRMNISIWNTLDIRK